jgi:hypothetical protein
MSVLKGANLALAFLLELCLLAALGYWGFRVGQGPLAKWALGLGSPLLLAAVWGAFMAPKAWRPLPGVAHLLAAIVLFGLGAAALYAAGQSRLAWIFAVAVVLNQALALLWRQ